MLLYDGDRDRGRLWKGKQRRRIGLVLRPNSDLIRQGKVQTPGELPETYQLNPEFRSDGVDFSEFLRLQPADESSSLWPIIIPNKFNYYIYNPFESIQFIHVRNSSCSVIKIPSSQIRSCYTQALLKLCLAFC